MDRVTLREKITLYFQKYKYVLLILALGLFLMNLPDASEEVKEQIPEITSSETDTPEDALEEILAQIAGVGKVRVLLTESSGAQTIYQTNEDRSGESVRVETVIISGSDRGEQGLIQRTDPPVYLGAIVVCQGGDSPSVRLAIVEAVANATGISTDHISVLKMK